MNTNVVKEIVLPALALVLIVLVAVVGVVAVAASHDAHKCADKGGTYSIDGHGTGWCRF
jgi:uncharacterized membrane protein